MNPDSSSQKNILILDPQGRTFQTVKSVIENHRLFHVRSIDEVIELLGNVPISLLLFSLSAKREEVFHDITRLRRVEQGRELAILFLGPAVSDPDFIRELYALGQVDYIFQNSLPEAIRAKIDFFVERSALLESHPAEDSARWNEYLSTTDLILESATDFAILSMDLAGRITSWNPGAELIFLYKREEIFGQPGEVIFTAEDRAVGYPDLEMKRTLEMGRAENERWHVRKDGSRFFARGLMMTLKDEAGLPHGFIKILRDRTAHRIAEDSLVKSKEHLQLAIEIAQMGTFEIDLLSDAVTVNEPGRLIYGWPGSETTFAEVQNYFHPDDKADVLEAVAKALDPATPGTFEMEHRIINTAGETRWIKVRGRAMFQTQAGVRRAERCVGAYLDVTERKITEEALKRRGAGLQLIAETATELLSETQPGKIVEAALKKTAALLGAEVYFSYLLTDDSQRLQLAVSGGVDEETRRNLQFLEFGKAVCGMVAQEMSPMSFENIQRGSEPITDLVRSLGVDAYACHPLMVRGQLFGTLSIGTKTRPRFDSQELGILQAIAHQIASAIEREKSDAELRLSEQRFRLTADHAPVLMWISDREGKCTWFNKPWLDFTGKSSREQIGERFLEGVHPEDRSARAALFRSNHFESGGVETEYRLLNNAGEYRWMLERSSPLLAPGIGLKGYIGSCVDVTEMKSAQEGLREQDRRKDQFIAMLAHELRNPLGPIRNAMHLLKFTQDHQTLERVREIVNRQVEHLAHIVSDLLDVSRVNQSKIHLRSETIDLKELLRVLAEDEKGAFETSGVQLEVHTLSAPVWVNGDRTRLTQVFQNLLSNARKFTPREGKVGISMREDGAYVVVEVTDTGIGLDPRLFPQIFEPFTQADESLDRSKGGLGLGLALVKGLVDLHGGQVTGHSDGLGKGATFVVRLPIARHLHGGKSADVIHRTTAVHDLRVLIIEDNQDAAESLKLLLELQGCEVRSVHNGHEGLAIATETRPDLVLCDIGLPGLSGYEVAAGIHQRCASNRPVLVALTGYGGSDNMKDAEAAGFDRHFTKPVDPDQIERLLVHIAGAKASNSR